jgi:hypothetical protein
VYLTLEEYLDLTDQDIQMLMSMNAGEALGSPFYGSAIKSKGRVRTEEEQENAIEEDRSIDYEPEVDEPTHYGAEETPGEDFPEMPDEMLSGSD